MSKVEVRRGSLNIEGELQVQSVCSRAASASQLSIVCSVFSKDPMRWQRIEGHAENLSNQTVPVVPIYILEEGEKCPASLDATIVSVNLCSGVEFLTKQASKHLLGGLGLWKYLFTVHY